MGDRSTSGPVTRSRRQAAAARGPKKRKQKPATGRRPAARPSKDRRTAAASQLGAASSSQGGADLAASHPALVDETAGVDGAIFNQYEHVPWSPFPSFRQILQPARFPSPFSPLFRQWQDTPGNDELLNGVRYLYGDVIEKEDSLLQTLTTGYFSPESGEELAGYACWCEHTAPPGGEIDDEPDILVNGTWVDSREYTYVAMEMRRGPGEETMVNETVFCGLKLKAEFAKDRVAGYHFFIYNSFDHPITVNGILIDKNTVAGPLPDFSIITVGGFHFFWWGSKAAVEYYPEEARGTKRRREEIDDELNPNTDRPVRRIRTNSDPRIDPALLALQTPRHEWCHQFKLLVEECIRLPKAEDPQNPVHHVKIEAAKLTLDDVVLAIASVWRGRPDTLSQFAFSNPILFEAARQTNTFRSRCVRSKEPFIIPVTIDYSTVTLDTEPISNNTEPLALPFSTSGTRGLGYNNFKFPLNPGPGGQRHFPLPIYHMVLAIAQLSGTSDVQLNFFDNSPGSQDPDLIRRIARNIVRNSAWLPNDVPKFTGEVWKYPPPIAESTSAFHTILNAWAFILNIELGQKWPLGNRREFYKDGHTLINLALDGRVDGRTIEAFLQSYGYAAFKDVAFVRDAEEEEAMTARSHGMSLKTLNEALQTLHESDRRARNKYPQSRQGKRTKPTEVPTVQEVEKEQHPIIDSWESQLQIGMERFQQGGGMASTDTRITTTKDMVDDDVVLAIACVWEGLRQYGIEYAYGTTDCFRFNRGSENINPDMTVVFQPHPLIMPLLFVPEYDGRNSVGHHILAVAERSSAASNEVKLVFMDSAPTPGSEFSAATSTAIQSLVRNSGWMGVDSEGHPIPCDPIFSEEWRSCPSQELGNTCGFYLILNAWAYMLGIPVNPNVKRRKQHGPHTPTKFQKMGLDIINMAMAGNMDSRVIHAFMNEFGYSEDETFDITSTVFGATPTVRLTQENLQQLVLNRRREEMAAADPETGSVGPPGPTWSPFETGTGPQTGPRPIGTFQQAQIAALLHTGHTREAVQEVLEQVGTFEFAWETLNAQLRPAPPVPQGSREESIAYIVARGHSREVAETALNASGDHLAIALTFLPAPRPA